MHQKFRSLMSLTQMSQASELALKRSWISDFPGGPICIFCVCVSRFCFSAQPSPPPALLCSVQGMRGPGICGISTHLLHVGRRGITQSKRQPGPPLHPHSASALQPLCSSYLRGLLSVPPFWGSPQGDQATRTFAVKCQIKKTKPKNIF